MYKVKVKKYFTGEYLFDVSIVDGDGKVKNIQNMKYMGVPLTSMSPDIERVLGRKISEEYLSGYVSGEMTPENVAKKVSDMIYDIAQNIREQKRHEGNATAPILVDVMER